MTQVELRTIRSAAWAKQLIESYVALPDYESTLHGDNVGSASSNAIKSTRKLHGMLMYFFRDRGVRTGVTRPIVDATVAIL